MKTLNFFPSTAFIALLFLFLHQVRAQDLDDLLAVKQDDRPVEVNLFTGNRIGVGHSVKLPYPGELEMFIGHRFGSIDGGFYELFGLDQATMRLGFDYGFHPRFSAGFGRSTFEKSYDIYGKMVLSRQVRNGFPFSSALYASGTVNTLKFIFPEGKNSLSDRMSYSAHLLLARRQGIFSLQLMPTWIYSVYDYRSESSSDLVALGLAGGIRVSSRFSLTAEYFLRLTEPSVAVTNPLTLGMDIDTGGHLFQLVLGNTTAMNEKTLLLNTADTWKSGKLYFGFNLIRTFTLKY